MAVSKTICLDCERKSKNGICRVVNLDAQNNYKHLGECPFKYLEGGIGGSNGSKDSNQNAF